MTINVFITGQKRTGKSSLLQEIVKNFSASTGGYFVQRLFTGADFKAFRMVDFTKEDYVLEKRLIYLSEETNIFAQVSASGSSMTIYSGVFDTFGTEVLHESLRNNKKIILLDEVGRIELDSEPFMAAVFHVLDSPAFVLGTIKKETNLFLDSIRRRSDVIVLDLDYHEPDSIAQSIIAMFVEHSML